MAKYERRDPLLGYNFRVALLDSKDSGGVGLGTLSFGASGLGNTTAFAEVSGLEVNMEVEDYQSGGINDHVLKFAGRMKWANLVLKRGLVARRDPLDTTDLSAWIEGYLDGKGVRKDGIIVLLDENRNPRLTWSFRRGLPLKWSGPSLDANHSQIAFESVEIAHEGLRLVRSGGLLGGLISEGASALAGAIF